MVKFLSVCLLCMAVLQGWACRSASQSEKIAEVDGAVITRADVDHQAGKALYSLREQLYRVERQKLEEYIGATLLTREANSKGVSVSTLLEQEVSAKVPNIAEAEIEEFYNQNKARLQVGLDKVHDQIRDYLREQKAESQKKDFIKSLRAKAKVTTYLKAPAVFRAEVPVTGAPVRGPEKAAVTIV